MRPFCCHVFDTDSLKCYKCGMTEEYARDQGIPFAGYRQPKKESKMNPDYKKIAVEATRDFIIELLQAGKYCEAKRYGKALAILIDGGLGIPSPTPPVYGDRDACVGR